MKYDLALQRAMSAAGGATKLARSLNIVPSAVTQWTRVPAKHCIRVSELTGIALHDLRPDVYPAPESATCP